MSQATILAWVLGALVALAVAAAFGFVAGLMVSGDSTVTDGGIALSGMNNAGNNISYQNPPGLLLARRMNELRVGPQIDEPTLRAIGQAVMNKAREGETDAALFAAELARLQRQPTTAATTAATPTTRPG